MSESTNLFAENKSTALRVSVMVAALGLGFIGALLLPASPWGINVFIFTAALLGAILFLTRRNQLVLTGGGRWLVFPILLFAALIAWRDSRTLLTANVLALLMCLGLAVLRTQRGRLRVAGIVEYVLDWSQSGFIALLGGALLLIGTSWREVSFGKRAGSAAAVIRGLVIALPLLLIFGGLFAAADAVFQGLLRQVFNLDTRTIFDTIGWTLFWSWLVAGFLYALLIYRAPSLLEGLRPAWLALGSIEIGIVLGLLNALFIAFVIVQVRYFFGGADLVQTTTGLTYAEYARRGFLELVTVAALALPVFLITHWLSKPNAARTRKLFNALAVVLIAMLFVIMVSAVQRMSLYVEVFGLTELRLYTTAFMAWLALVFIWFMFTVSRGARERFAFGALTLGFGVLLILNALNPDEVIARTNLNRPNAAEPFDARYIASLSADAIPTLITALPTLNQKDVCTITHQIIANRTPPQEFGVLAPPKGWTWTQPASYDWRTFNLSRTTAWQITAANWQTISGACPKN